MLHTKKAGFTACFFRVEHLFNDGGKVSPTSLREPPSVGLRPPERALAFFVWSLCLQNRVTVPRYTEQVEFELEQIQVYARFILLDNVTGYRSQYQEYSTLLTAL